MNTTRDQHLLAGIVPGRIDMLTDLSEAEWEELIASWSAHRLVPLVWTRLRNAPVKDRVPPKVRERFRNDYRRAVAHNSMIRDQLTDVLQAFHAASIDAVLLKGLHLNLGIHGDLGARELWDIDVLVPETDLARTQDVLLDAGYGPTDRPSIKEQCARHRHLLPFMREGNAPVEVHWTIETYGGPYRVDPDGIHRRAVRADLDGLQLRVLCPEDLVLYMALKVAYQDQFNMALRGLWDLAEVLRKEGDRLDWDGMHARAGQWKVTRCLSLCLHHVSSLFDTHVPREWFDRIREPGAEPFIDVSRERIFRMEADRQSVMSPRMARLARESSLGGKITAAVRSAVPSPRTLAALYDVPPRMPQILLLYPQRLISLLRRRSVMLLRLLRTDRKAVALAERVDRKSALQRWLESGAGD